MNREQAINYLHSSGFSEEQINTVVDALSEPKTGHWIRISPAGIYECSKCGQNVMTSDICAYKFCHGCGTKMIEPQERSRNEKTDTYNYRLWWYTTTDRVRIL